jgi:hypothetical protein
MAPSAGSSALRVKFHDVGLHRHPSRPRARPASVPAPRAPILEAQRRCRAPARALNLPPPFPESGSRFGSPPARRIARCTSPTKLVGYRRIPPIRRSVARPPPRSRTLPGRMRTSSSLRAIRRRLEAKRYRATPECGPRDAAWRYQRRRRCGHLRFAACHGRRPSER